MLVQGTETKRLDESLELLTLLIIYMFTHTKQPWFRLQTFWKKLEQKQMPIFKTLYIVVYY